MREEVSLDRVLFIPSFFGVEGPTRLGSQPEENSYCRHIEVWYEASLSSPTHNFLRGQISLSVWDLSLKIERMKIFRDPYILIGLFKTFSDVMSSQC